uniref:Uncharacterized protein n=1 Tax=Arundo donax TaxID=35708 RepID=A0A0A8XS05_ARUDO
MFTIICLKQVRVSSLSEGCHSSTVHVHAEAKSAKPPPTKPVLANC